MFSILDFHKTSSLDQLTVLCLCTSANPKKKEFIREIFNKNREMNGQLTNYEATLSTQSTISGPNHEQVKRMNFSLILSINIILLILAVSIN